MDFKYDGKSKIKTEFEKAKYFELSTVTLENRKPRLNLNLFVSMAIKSIAEKLGLKPASKDEKHYGLHIYGFYIFPLSVNGNIPRFIFKSALELLRDGNALPVNVDDSEEATNSPPLYLKLKIIGLVDSVAKELSTQIYSFEYSNENSMVTIKLTKPESKYLSPRTQIVISKHYTSDEDYKNVTEEAVSWILSTINENL